MTKPERKNKEKCPNRITLIERDIIRSLIVPKDTDRKFTTLVTQSQFDRIKENSLSLPKTPEKSEINVKSQLEDERQKYETARDEVERLKIERESQMSEDEKRKRKEILARREKLKREEDDLIKKCNSLILGVKCKAIQDAQVAEREMIKRQLKQRENLLDTEMENERERDSQRMQKEKEKDWTRKKDYAESILQQIRNNEEKRLGQMEKAHREYVALKLKIRREESEEEEQRRQKSAKKVEEKQLNRRVNDEIIRNKEIERQLQILENLKMQEIAKRELQQEKELEKRRRKENQLQERELARLWKLQTKSHHLRDIKDEIIYERTQEQLQKKWREQELQNVQAKMRQIEEIKKIRDRQVQERRILLGCKHEERRQEAESIISENLRVMQELDQMHKKQKQMMEHYKNVLHDQINEKKRRKESQREEILKEGKDLIVQSREHDQIIKKTMKEKIDQIKTMDIPNEYINNLEKQLQVNRD